MKTRNPSVKALLVVMLAMTCALPKVSAQQVSRPVGDPRDAELADAQAWHTQYRADNARVRATGHRPNIVFLGDSITEGWPQKVPSFFSPDRIGRGVSGETSAEMLTRFQQDVIELRPRVVHIMAGTNDIAGLVAFMTPEETQANIRSMCELARMHGIRVIIASVPPADHFSWRPGLETASKIRALNNWLQNYARASGAVYANYWAVLHAGNAMRAELGPDGVHPNEKGYAAMAPVAEVAMRKALNGMR
jgi:lysophospholipase L1-like esterase